MKTQVIDSFRYFNDNYFNSSAFCCASFYLLTNRAIGDSVHIMPRLYFACSIIFPVNLKNAERSRPDVLYLDW